MFLETFLWAAAVICFISSLGVFFRIHREVMVAALPKSKKPLKTLFISLNNGRTFQKHKKFFPHSPSRVVYWGLLLVAVFLLLAAVGISSSHQ
jgi:hypothetical protein